MSSKNTVLESKVACIIPCHNEEVTIGEVIKGLFAIGPGMDILVIDNNCTDRTAEIASKLGAIVIQESELGKGHAIRKGFLLCNHQIVIMIDGDATYSLEQVPQMIRMIEEGFDMVVGRRVARSVSAFPKFHSLGNSLFSKMHVFLLLSKVVDSFSGLRVFNRAFIKSFNSDSQGFDIETDLNNFASILGARVGNIDVEYFERDEESRSKLRTFRDGRKIFFRTIKLAWRWRPAALLFLPITLLLFIGAFLVQGPVLKYFDIGLVPRLPSLLTGLLFLLTSLILFLYSSTASRISKMEIGLLRINFQQLKSFGAN